MKLLFDCDSVSFSLTESVLAPVYQRLITHLRHIDIPFRPWDNPYAVSDRIDRLFEYGQAVGVDVDRDKCARQDQDYFNFLHRIYEKNYNGDPTWLDYHEHIHLCEFSNTAHRYLHIDFREKAGLLEKSFDIQWMKSSTTQIKAGDVFVPWAELGKTPYRYWRDKEPDDINRIKELCKPWLKLRPKILVALEDYDYSKTSSAFDQWWQQYHDEWCQHWNISKWDLTDMRSRIVFGNMPVEELDKMKKLLQDKKIPRRISL